MVLPSSQLVLHLRLSQTPRMLEEPLSTFNLGLINKAMIGSELAISNYSTVSEVGEGLPHKLRQLYLHHI